MSAKELTIFVQNVSQSEDITKVKRLFSMYGKVNDVFWEESKLYVKFEDSESAKKAETALTREKRYLSDDLDEVIATRLCNLKPDILVILHLIDSEIKLFENYFKDKEYFDKFIKIITNKGPLDVGVIYFKQTIDYDALISELKNSNIFNKRYYYERQFYTPPEKKELIARKIEERTLFVNYLYTKLDDSKIVSLFSQYGKVLDIFHMRKYEMPLINILMDTKQNAKAAIRGLNFMRINNQIETLSVSPYQHRFLNHAPAGLLVVNEIEESFSSAELFREFDKFGEVMQVSVCPVSYSFVCFVLFKDFARALNAATNCKRKNLYLFPPIDAMLAIRLFPQQILNPNFTCVTFGHNPNRAAPFIRNEIDPEHESIDFFTVHDKKTDTQICATRFRTINAMRKTLLSYLERNPNTRFELIGTSTYQKAFDLFTSMPLDDQDDERLFYAKGVSEEYTNKELRHKFEKIAKVDAAFHINRSHTILVQFSRGIDKNDPRLLDLFPAPIYLEKVYHPIDMKKTDYHMSKGELSATLSPARYILENGKYSQKELKEMNQNQIIGLIAGQPL